jgi:LPPG:FO 2-phospho-L-lactate transferase (EC 2.7.1.-)
MMITLLSGGTGTPKLLWGMRDLLEDTELTVVVNTAEDIWMSGNHLSPDIDTVIYLCAGLIDTGTWWGIRGDTFLTHEALHRRGSDEYLAIGDQDRATHILRGERLRKGERLTPCTSHICRMFGVTLPILPMTDVPVATMVTTLEGEMHFQEFWVRHRGTIPISGVHRQSSVPPVTTPEVRSALEKSDAVIIGPSNPVTSIMPILECPGILESLSGRPVLAVSPFIGLKPVSGPAGVLMQAWGKEPSSRGTFDLYHRLNPVFLQDIRDEVTLPGAFRYDTLMKDQEKSRNLAEYILKILKV